MNELNIIHNIYINTVSVKGTYFVFKTNKKRITNALIEDIKDKMLPYVKNIKNLSNETLKDFFISKFEKLEQNKNTYNIIGDVIYGYNKKHALDSLLKDCEFQIDEIISLQSEKEYKLAHPHLFTEFE